MDKFHVDCYGEALVDLIVQPYAGAGMNSAAQACLGGSVFNFCIAAQRQGLQTSYLNALSHDMFGQQFAQLLRSEGARCAQSADHHLPTSMAVVQLSPTGQASYAFHRQAVADTALSAIEVIASFTPEQQLLHTGCLMLVPQAWGQTQQIMQAALSRGSLLSVDANLRLSVCPDAAAYRPCVLAACALADVVKVSDDDLIALGLLAESQRQDTAALQATAQALLLEEARTQLIALTLGAQGAWLISRSAQAYQLSPQGLQVQDTVGAGDSFFAALLAALASLGQLQPQQLPTLATFQLQAALSHAVAAASIGVERVGCDPATWSETVSRKQSFISGQS